ncbi:MAG: lipoate--protein ligase family protein, partial [Hadesarchaea archaeon]|nr:lipoate--protein ligase family protein [Hadesarchaea archaeon]
TTVERELGKRPSFEQVREAMVKGFEAALNVELVEGEMEKAELDLAAELRSKYASQEWLRKR